MASTYVISAPVSNADGSITFSGTISPQISGLINPQPVSVTLNASGISQVLAVPTAIAARQAIIQLFITAATTPAVPVVPTLSVVLTTVAGTIVQ